MDKDAVRSVLEHVAAFLALKGEESAARIRAYQDAARAELAATGRSTTLDELREQIPPGLGEMLRIPGLGVAKVRQINEQLHIESLAELEDAAVDGRLAALPRFGPKAAENVRKGIAALREGSAFRLLHHALAEAESIARGLAALDGVRRVDIAGSVRRRREIIRDLDFVVVYAGEAGGTRDALIKRLDDAPGVIELAGKQGGLTLRFASGTVVDVFLTPESEAGLSLLRATGSLEHVAQLEAYARTRGVALEPGSAWPDEESVYRAVGLPWIAPEVREGMGEIGAAAAGRLPRLLEQRDLKGFLHCHTNYSDGTTTVAEWAEACRAAGYEWMGITDHSESSAYAGGLRAEHVARQHAEIDAANRRHDDFRILKGVEADILADGSLDYGPAVLDRFDFVIASIHTRFGMSEAEMTTRVLRALDDPHTTILGHPTGRLLLSRDPYAIDMEQVLERAALRGVAVEVNADPHRLDLDWRMVRRARELGGAVPISLGADAHSVAGMTNVALGVAIARKGWLEADDVLNTRDAEGFLALARRRRPPPVYA
ncbi:MAG TPA: PHP domain-containing protein [Gemmatimonadales bacterium]|nr:PHP domain-containing protein [Gemmatimonadales bacterium]